MGYSTDFFGVFEVAPTLKKEHREYLDAFANIRHMKRDPVTASALPDELREKVGLPIGIEGEFFVGSHVDGNFGQDKDDSIMDYNYEPQTQPGLWCKWVPNEEGDVIEWTGAEKFYDYVEWLQYLITNFLEPWGYMLNGECQWEGEDRDDMGMIIVENNVIETKRGRIVYE